MKGVQPIFENLKKESLIHLVIWAFFIFVFFLQIYFNTGRLPIPF